MKLIPTKSQFNNWSLPSKASYLSLIIGIPLAIFLFGIQYYIGPTKSAQDNLNVGQLDIKEGVAANNKILQQMNKIETAHDFIEKYPLGYCLFAIDRKTNVIPNFSRLDELFFLDWSTASIAKITVDSIFVKVPNILSKDNAIKVIGVTSGVRRKPGSVDQFLTMKGIRFITEYIGSQDGNIILLIGAKQDTRNK